MANIEANSIGTGYISTTQQSPAPEMPEGMFGHPPGRGQPQDEAGADNSGTGQPTFTDGGFEPQQYTQYTGAQQDAASQQLAWRGMDALWRNWQSLSGTLPTGADASAPSRGDLQAAISQLPPTHPDFATLSQFIEDTQAFAYVDRLGGCRNSRIELSTLSIYAGSETARSTLLSDAAMLDTAYKGHAENVANISDGQISWEDIQSRIADPSTPPEMRSLLLGINRSTYDLLRGDKPFIQLSALALQAPADHAPRQPSHYMPSILEDDTDNLGQTVVQILNGSATDADNDSLGLALTAQNAGNGQWQYSQDGGYSWQTVPPVDDLHALLLAPTDKLRFLPNGQSGSDASLTYRAWDQSSGQAGGLADVSMAGGASAFSIGTDTVGIQIQSVNDAPVLNPAPAPDTKPEPKPSVPSLAKQPELIQYLIDGGILLDTAQAGSTDTPDGIISTKDVTALADRPDFGSMPKDLQTLVGKLRDDKGFFSEFAALGGNQDGRIHISKVVDWAKKNLADINTGRYETAVKGLAAIRENAGFLDTASGGKLDGRVGQSDIEAAAKSFALADDQKQVLANLAADPSAFSMVERVDGKTDYLLDISSGGAPPDEKQAQYSQQFFDLQKELDTQPFSDSFGIEELEAQAADKDASRLVKSLANDPGAFAALDRMDDKPDGTVDATMQGVEDQAWYARFLQSEANNGSGDTIMQAAVKQLMEKYKDLDIGSLPEPHIIDRARAAVANQDTIDAAGGAKDGRFNRDDLRAAADDKDNKISDADRDLLRQLADDDGAFAELDKRDDNEDGNIQFNRLREMISLDHQSSLSRAMSAKSALAQGVPLPDDKFTSDMDAAYMSSHILDAEKVDQVLNRIMSDPAVQADLSEAMVSFTSNPEAKAREVLAELSSPYYASMIRQIEKDQGSGKASERMQSDLAVLSNLELGLSRRDGKPFLIDGESPSQMASFKLAENLTAAIFNESDFTNTDPEVASQAIEDVLGVALGLRASQAGIRLVGNFEALADGMEGVKADFAKFKGNVSRLADSLASIFKSTQQSGGQLTNSVALLDEAQRLTTGGVLSQAAADEAKSFLSTLNKHGLLGSAAGVFGVTSSAYRLADPNDPARQGDPWGRLSASLGLVATLSYSSSIAKTGALLIDTVSGGSAGATFSKGIETRFPDLLRNALANPANVVADGVEASADAGLRAGSSAMRFAATVRGVGLVSDVAGGAISIALGVHDIVTGANEGRADVIVGGSLNVVAGASWAVAGVAALVGSTVALPLLVVGGVFALAAMFVSAAFGPAPTDAFADRFQDEWKSLGVLKDDWRDGADGIKDWYLDNLEEDDSIGGMS